MVTKAQLLNFIQDVRDTFGEVFKPMNLALNERLCLTRTKAQFHLHGHLEVTLWYYGTCIKMSQSK